MFGPQVVQANVSFSRIKGTMRGLHYQVAPHAETKLIRCTHGAIFDVVVDIEPESPTFMQWLSIELTADNYKMLYVPEGVAHGFLTLEDNTEIFYQMSECYAPEHARGFRWNDAAFAIKWPEEIQVISERDQNYADFTL